MRCSAIWALVVPVLEQLYRRIDGPLDMVAFGDRERASQFWDGGIHFRLHTSVLLHRGCLKDALNRCIQQLVEFGIGLPGGQSLDQSPRKTRDHAVVSTQARVGIVARVTP